MKKLWFIALAVVAMAMLGCPSDPAKPPPKKLGNDEFDFTINGGNYKVEIPTDGEGGFVITDGEQYRVTFVVEAADDDFYGSRVGGKLIYKDAEDKDKVLSGWTWLKPPFISGPGRYRWTLKAGDKGVDGESETLVSPATTPDGFKQYFTLNAQTPEYKQYASYFEHRIKGSITVAKYTPPVGTAQKTADIAMNFDGASHDAAIGKGNIEGAEFDKVKAAATNGAFLKLYIVNAKVTALAGSEGHGVGSVGNRDDDDKGNNPNYPLNIPRDTPANDSFSFQVDVEIEDALSFVGTGESHLFINMWGDGPAKCDKVELWEYK